MNESVEDQARALVARTTTAQGIPERVTDQATLAWVATILRASKNTRRDQ